MTRITVSDTRPSAGYFEDLVHVLPVRVYYEDTDAAGIVYYANYLRYMERGRTDLLRSLGVTHTALRNSNKEPHLDTLFVVRRCEVEYLKPARLDDCLSIYTKLAVVGGASLTMEQVVRRDGADLVEAIVRIGCVAGDGRPKRIPAQAREAFRPLMKNNEETLRNAC